MQVTAAKQKTLGIWNRNAPSMRVEDKEKGRRVNSTDWWYCRERVGSLSTDLLLLSLMNAARADRPLIEENDSRDDKAPKRLCQTPVYKSVNKIKTVMDVSLTRRCSGLAPIEFQLKAETYWEQIIYSNPVTSCRNLMKEIKHAINTLHGGNCCSSVDSSYVQIYCDLKMEEADTGLWMLMWRVEGLKTKKNQSLRSVLKERWLASNAQN